MKTIFNFKTSFSLLRGLLMILFLCGSTIIQVNAQQKVRTYANFQGTYEYGLNAVFDAVPKGTVTSPANAIDKNVKTSSTLGVGLGALGLGGAIQYLEFTTDGTHANKRTLQANTPVSIKLRLPASVLGLASGVSIGTFTNLVPVAASNPAIGSTNNAGYNTGNTSDRKEYFNSTSLLSALNAAGDVEITIVPTTTFNGVYVQLSSLLSLGLSADLFHAYILEDAPASVACESKIDMLSGRGSYIETIKLADVLGTITNPWGPVDGSGDGVANFSGLAGVNTYLYHTTIFNAPSVLGDTVSITVRNNGGIADVSLLKNAFQVQTFNRDVAGASVQGTSNLLSISLLPGNTIATIKYVPTTVFDRIQFRFGAILNVSVLGSVDLLSVQRIRPTPNVIQASTNAAKVYLFSGSDVTLNATIPAGNGVHWYDVANSGSSLHTGLTYPLTAVTANKSYYAASFRSGCTEESARSKVDVIVLTDASTALPVGISGKAYPAGGKIAVTSPDHVFTYTSTTVPAGFALNASTGAISATGNVPTVTTPTTYQITVNILENGVATGLTLTKDLTVYPPIALAGAAFPATDQTKTSYSADLKVLFNGPASGGKGSGYSYYLTPQLGGNTRVAATTAVPTDFVLSTDGILTGNPLNKAGSYTFDIYANDGIQETSATFTLFISEVPLPVKLASFKAAKEGETALISWSTTEEVNSERFDLERSGNGSAWEVIGSLASNGDSKDINTYSLTDAKPLGGQNLYRLKMVDRDGTFAFSKIEALNFKRAGITVQPNPIVGSEKIQVTVDDWSAVSAIRLLSLTGKVIYEAKGALTSGIATNNLTSGLYIVQVQKSNGSTSSYKIVKQ